MNHFQLGREGGGSLGKKMEEDLRERGGVGSTLWKETGGDGVLDFIWEKVKWKKIFNYDGMECFNLNLFSWVPLYLVEYYVHCSFTLKIPSTKKGRPKK